jgi:hypothetical protein
MRTAIVLVAATLALPAAAGDWPQYRGPGRDGISSETGLLKSWPEGGPVVAWRKPLGDGFSALVVKGDRLCTMFSGGGEEFAGCFDAGTGAELWRTRIDKAWSDDFGQGPRSTPTVDGELAYVLSSGGKLHALAVADGAVA